MIEGFAWRPERSPSPVSPFWLALCTHADRTALECRREAVEFSVRSRDGTVSARSVEACLTEKWLRAALREGFDDVVRAAWRRGELVQGQNQVYRVPPAVTGLPQDLAVFVVEHERAGRMRLYITTFGHCADHLEGVLCGDDPITEEHLTRLTADELRNARDTPWLRRDAERGALRWISLPSVGLLSGCLIPDLRAAAPPSRFLLYDRIDGRCAFASRSR
jgi:hypothetical protein